MASLVTIWQSYNLAKGLLILQSFMRIKRAFGKFLYIKIQWRKIAHENWKAVWAYFPIFSCCLFKNFKDRACWTHCKLQVKLLEQESGNEFWVYKCLYQHLEKLRYVQFCTFILEIKKMLTYKIHLWFSSGLYINYTFT